MAPQLRSSKLIEKTPPRSLKRPKKSQRKSRRNSYKDVKIVESGGVESFLTTCSATQYRKLYPDIFPPGEVPRCPRVFTRLRMQKVQQFMNLSRETPELYDMFGSEQWFQRLIGYLRDPRNTLLVSDVKNWMYYFPSIFGVTPDSPASDSENIDSPADNVSEDIHPESPASSNDSSAYGTMSSIFSESTPTSPVPCMPLTVIGESVAPKSTVSAMSEGSMMDSVGNAAQSYTYVLDLTKPIAYGIDPSSNKNSSEMLIVEELSIAEDVASTISSEHGWVDNGNGLLTLPSLVDANVTEGETINEQATSTSNHDPSPTNIDENEPSPDFSYLDSLEESQSLLPQTEAGSQNWWDNYSPESVSFFCSLLGVPHPSIQFLGSNDTAPEPVTGGSPPVIPTQFGQEHSTPTQTLRRQTEDLLGILSQVKAEASTHPNYTEISPTLANAEVAAKILYNIVQSM